MAFRTRHKTKGKGKSVWAIRTKTGKFKNIEGINRSIRRDAATKSKTVPKKRGQGFLGDYKYKKKKKKK